MKRLTILSVLLAVPLVASGQETPVKKGEVRIQVPGCAYNRTFITEEAPQAEGVGGLKPGRRLKMNGDKALLNKIKAQAPSMVELTGRIREADLADLRGIPVGGGIRIGGGAPRAGVGSGPTALGGYNEVIIDVEAFRLIPQTCPRR